MLERPNFAPKQLHFFAFQSAKEIAKYERGGGVVAPLVRLEFATNFDQTTHMNDFNDRRAGNRVRARLDAARTVGAWMPWMGVALALMLWAGAGIWFVGAMGVEGVLAAPPLQIVGAVLLLLATGSALIAAGIMARESRRSSESNALVLSSARLLLEPAEHSRSEIATIGEAVVGESQRVNRVLSDVRSQMDAMKADIEANVTAVLKAAEIVRTDSDVLANRMLAERQSLTELANSIRIQSENLAKSIPMHVQMFSDATKAAQDEVRRADESLDQRLHGLEGTARRLAERIDQLDTMGAESRKRAQNLATALMRLDEQLVQSTRMVDSARQAGELATAASKNTADALRDAMSDALDAAMKANETLSSRASAASQEAQAAMAQLQEMGVRTESTTRAAALAVRQQADETEQRMTRLAEYLVQSTTRATRAAESGLDQAKQKLERASLFSADKAPTEPSPAPVRRNEELQLKPSDIVAPKPTAFRDAESASKGFAPLLSEPGAPQSPDHHDDDHKSSGLSWRELLTGVEARNADGGQANDLLDTLGRNGVSLSVVKASDLRRIASASSQGELQRRRAIRDTAPGEIQRVSQLLDRDVNLQKSARTFLAVEGPQALRALATAETAREDAEPRLSAYLLLDAALSASS